jgi:FkbM family methyltransferase
MTQLPLTLNGEVVMRDTYEYGGLACRKDTYDEYVIKEIKRSYGAMDVRGRRVMDIGGNIGAASSHFLNKGADSVVVVEPEQSNFVCLKHNLGKFPEAILINGAVASEDGELNIYVSPTGKNPGNTTTTPRRGRLSQSVKAYSFDKLLELYSPDCLKVDCEGAEYDFLDGTKLPDYVKEVVMEIHLNDDNFRAAAVKLIESFKDWECVFLSNYGPKTWTALGHWRRK